MTRPTPEHPASLITFDDPRISEWIDGRLMGSEAEFVARAVAASPELARFVDDLRLLKSAVAGAKVAPPPAGFVQTVMDAIASDAPVGAGNDPAVEAEWQRLEAERITEERAEACDDVAAAGREPRRAPWTWLAMLAALAAGVLVAAGLNLLMRPSDREVALAPPGALTPQVTIGDGAAATSKHQDVPLPASAEADGDPRVVAERKLAAREGEAGAGNALATGGAAAVEEIVVLVDGLRGRATLARILEERGVGAASGALKNDRLEVAATPASIETLKVALGRLAEGGVRLPEAAKSFAAARSAAAVDADSIAAVEAPKAPAEPSRPDDALSRLVIRIVATAEPVADAPPEPAGEPRE